MKTENVVLNSITKDMLALARSECCNWFDSGDYCPLCEDSDKPRTCLLRLGQKCGYYMKSVHPLMAWFRARKRGKAREEGNTKVSYE